jgi:hypothetical protein
MRLPGRKYPWEINEAERARQHTYEAHGDTLRQLEEICDVWVAFSVYWHESRDETLRTQLLPFLEIPTESTASLIAAVHALYKAAQVALRNMLELSTSCMLFQRDEMAIPDYEGTDKTPHWGRKLLPLLDLEQFETYRQVMRRRGFHRLAEEMLPSWVNELYHSLSKPAHSHIDTWHIAQEFKGGLWPGYHRSAFLEWHRSFGRVHRVCFLALFLYFDRVSEWIRQEEAFLPWNLVLTPTQMRYLRLPSGGA